MEINLDKIKAFSASTLFQVVCSVIVPGFLLIFVFKRDLFLSLDMFRLILLSMSITTPILLLNSYAALQGLSRSPENTPEDEDEFHKYFSVSMFLGAVTTIPVVYIPIALGYFLSLTLKLSLIGALITEIAVLIYLYYETKYQKSS